MNKITHEQYSIKPKNSHEQDKPADKQECEHSDLDG